MNKSTFSTNGTTKQTNSTPNIQINVVGKVIDVGLDPAIEKTASDVITGGVINRGDVIAGINTNALNVVSSVSCMDCMSFITPPTRISLHSVNNLTLTAIHPHQVTFNNACFADSINSDPPVNTTSTPYAVNLDTPVNDHNSNPVNIITSTPDNTIYTPNLDGIITSANTPDVITSISCLALLHCSQDHVLVFMTWFTHFSQLNLSYCNLSIIPPLSLTPSLTHLNLSHNSIEHLLGIEQCLSLTSLSLSHNRIWDVYELRRTSRLPHLTSLDIHDNPLTKLVTIPNFH